MDAFNISICYYIKSAQWMNFNLYLCNISFIIQVYNYKIITLR